MMKHSADFSNNVYTTQNIQNVDDYCCVTCSNGLSISQDVKSWEQYKEEKEREESPMKLEDIKDFFEKNKEKYNIEYDNDYVELYLKTKSTLRPFSEIIDSNGDIVLNIKKEPKDMDYIWIEGKEKNCACGVFLNGSPWGYGDNNIQRYKKILGTLSGDDYNYYKVKVSFKDIKSINGANLKINTTKMEIAERISSTPEITFNIIDVKENGDLVVELHNSLTHSTSPEFKISAEYEDEIIPAIERKIEDMHTAIELAKNSGNIFIASLSAGLQDYISKGE